jgi:hypothetical protein
MRFLLIFLSIVALSTPVFSQSGDYFLSQYTPNDERIDYLSYGMAQDKFGLLYFTNKNGVLEFDGKHWFIVNTPGAVYTIATVENEVFAAGIFGFGKLQYNEAGQRVFQKLSDSLKEGKDIFGSVVVGDFIYFLNEQHVFKHAVTTGENTTIASSPAQGIFTHLFRLENEVFIQSETGLWKLDKNGLTQAPFTWNATDPISFSAYQATTQQKIIGTESGKLYLAKSDQIQHLPLKDAARLVSSVMVNATWLSEQKVAIGTLRGGVFFVDITTGTIEEITDYQSGLPDNEVYALFADRNQGVWVAHDYGFTRIAPHLPFRSYNHYPGLQGNLLCAISWDNTVYVGTTVGLWRLEREEVVEQIGSSITQRVTPASKPKNAFFRLFRKKKNQEPAASGKTETREPVFSVKEVRLVYRAVSGIEGKVGHLFQAQGRLLAAGVAGVFEVNKVQSKAIWQEPVRTAFHSPSLNQLVVSTYADELLSFAQTNSQWTNTHLLDTLKEHISYMFEDKLENLWLCGRNQIFKVEVVEGEVSDISVLAIDNPSIDETVGLAYGSEIYVAASGEFKRYDSQKNLFVTYDSLPGPRKYFASSGNFWFNDGHRWRTIDRKIQNLKLDWLGLFPNLRFLAPADQGLWVITANNELYKFSGNADESSMQQERYPLFLREVKARQTQRVPTRQVKINQEEGAVSFEFIQPDYVSLQAMEYRFLVKGLSKEWTSWSTDNNIANFSYLPPGKYQLHVQSRDLLARESEIQVVNFEVLPPYWKRWWFYAVEFIVFAALVILSMRLSGMNTKYRLISRLLSMITIVLLIQFIQTTVYSLVEIKSSPVIEFGIQVLIALMVFPIEHYLRKWMYRSSEGRFLVDDSNRNKP